MFTAMTDPKEGIRASKPRAQYSSFIARLILRRFFRDQWIIPEASPRIERVLQWYERRRMVIDTSKVALDRPIFFLSMPRCGSSMLQDLMSAHPDVAYITNMMHQFRRSFCAAEHFRQRLGLDVEGERFLGDSVKVSSASPADPVGTWGDWLGLDPYSLEYTEPRADQLGAAAKERIAEDIRRVIWCFDHGGGRRFLCKTPALLPHMRLLNDLFPDAKFIHLIRDPRMSANSLVKLYRRSNEQLNAIRARARRRGQREDWRPFVPYPRLPRLADYVNEYGADDIRTTANLWRDGVNYFEERKAELGNYLVVRYEDIVADPRSEVKRILDFCELEPVPASNSQFWGALSRVGAIHHKNRYGHLAEIEEICAAEMLRYGYL
jgi:hypothetical protein